MKKLLFGTFMAALAIVALLPSTVLAAKPLPFSASGHIMGIETEPPFCVVKPAGESGRWVIVTRQIKGTVSGDISGDFILDYSGNVDAFQVGNIHGTISIGQYTLKMDSKTLNPIPIGYYQGLLIVQLSISGHWSLIQGAKGQGDVDATLYFLTDGTHVLSIYPDVESPFSLTGQWQP
jgi:hypothetical protein